MRKIVEEDWTGFNIAVRHRQNAEPLWQPRRREIQIAPLPPAMPPPRQPLPADHSASALRSEPGLQSPRSGPGGARPVPTTAPAGRSPAGTRWRGWIGIVLLILLLVVLVNLSWQREPQAPTQGATAERVVTNYTTFHTIAFQGGSVVTGWKFDSNRASVPSTEYCYFSSGTAGAQGAMTFDIETRPSHGRYEFPKVGTMPLTARQWEEAATKCRWHGSSRPVTRTPA